MQKWIFLTLFVLAGVFGLSALFGEIASKESAKEEDEAVSSQLKIVATNWAFDQSAYALQSGEATKISFVNKEGIHAIEIIGEGVDIKLDRNTPSQMVTFEKPGTYEIICVLPCGEGHVLMVSTLTVS